MSYDVDDLNKYVERHAYNSYKEFLITHEEELKSQPAPQVAIDYYTKEDLYMFDAFQSDRVLTTGGYNDIDDGRRREEQRRPVIENLYDVFVNIRDDEAEHAETMAMLQRDVSLTSRGKK